MPETSQFKEVTLYRTNHDGLTAVSAIETLTENAPGNPYIIIYTPTHCGFAYWKNGAIIPLKGDSDVKDIFEVRAFCETYEIRWTRENDKDTGRAVLLSEKEPVRFSATKTQSLLALAGKYLLWGAVSKKTQEDMSGGIPCSALFEHRTGEILIPLPHPQEGQKASLRFKEYFSPDQYGNLILQGERLTGLEWCH